MGARGMVGKSTPRQPSRSTRQLQAERGHGRVSSGPTSWLEPEPDDWEAGAQRHANLPPGALKSPMVSGFYKKTLTGRVPSSRLDIFNGKSVREKNPDLRRVNFVFSP